MPGGTERIKMTGLSIQRQLEELAKTGKAPKTPSPRGDDEQRFSRAEEVVDDSRRYEWTESADEQRQASQAGAPFRFPLRSRLMLIFRSFSSTSPSTRGRAQLAMGGTSQGASREALGVGHDPRVLGPLVAPWRCELVSTRRRGASIDFEAAGRGLGAQRQGGAEARVRGVGRARAAGWERLGGREAVEVSVGEIMRA